MSEALSTNQKRRIITINGVLGAGKSTAMNGLADLFGYDRFSSGDYFRDLSTKRGLDLLSGNYAAENDRSMDDEVDAKVREVLKKDRIVVDSRLAWYWAPDSFKVYLHLDSLVAAQRVIAKKTAHRVKTEKIPTDPMQYAAILDERLAVEHRRYQELYGVDSSDMSNYDQVIDTTYTSAEEVVKQIAEKYQQFLTS